MADYSNVNIENLVDVSAGDFEKNDGSINSAVEMPLATKSVWDSERSRMEQVPINYDADDFNFAMRTQRDGIDKSAFMGKTEIGDITPEIDDFYATPAAEKKEFNIKDVIYKQIGAPAFLLKSFSESNFGKGAISFGQQIIEQFPKGAIRNAETEIEELKAGRREKREKDLSGFKDYFAGNIEADEVERPDIVTYEPIEGRFFENGTIVKRELTPEERQQRIAQLETTIKNNKALLEKTQEWFKDYQIDENASSFDQFMYGLGNAGSSVGYAFGVAAVTKNPAAATAIIAGSFGKLQLEETYEKARKADVKPQEAEKMGFQTATVSGILEAFGFKWLEKAVKANTIFKRVAKSMLTEGLQEGTQQAAVEGMESAYGIDVKTWDEIAADSLYAALIGSVAGGATAGVSVAFNPLINERSSAGEIISQWSQQSPDQRVETLTESIKDKIREANPELEEDTINNLAQDIAERAEGSVIKATDAINQVIGKESYFETNDLTFDMWLKQVKQNLLKRGYTEEQIEEKAKQIQAKNDLKTGFGQVYEAARKDLEAGLGEKLSDIEKDQAAELFAANAISMYNTYKAAKSPLEAYQNLRVRFETVLNERVQENPEAYGMQQTMGQDLLPSSAYDKNGKADINTPEFKAWFGDSKVVDEQGKPLVVYHGTDRTFNKFKRGKTGYLGGGIYLTDDIKKAKRYTNYPDGIMELYASIKNPLVVTTNEPAKEILSVIYGNDKTYQKRVEKLKRKTDSLVDTQIISKKDIDRLQDLGYDGIIWEFYGEKEINVFNPNQIKSVYNRGTFSADSDNIYYQEDNKINSVFDLRVGDKTKELGVVNAINYDSRQIKIGGKWYDMLRVDTAANQKGITIISDNYEKIDNEVNDFSDNSYKKVSENREAVNEQKAKNYEYNEIAKDYFGITNNLDLGGYVLTDGSLLDLSGKKLGSDGRNRSVDHREISDAFENNSVSMEDFINSGNIRYMPESNSILMADVPNAKQYKIISQIIDKANGEITVELMSDANNWGSDKDYSRTYENITLSKLKRDINAFYKGEGLSEINKFYQTAYAGSRVDYDTPSLEALGSGEGNLAHGWGLYYALNREVAEDYRRTFIGDDDDYGYCHYYKGQKIKYDINNKDNAHDRVFSDIMSGSAWYEKTSDWSNKIKELKQEYLKQIDEANGYLARQDVAEDEKLKNYFENKLKLSTEDLNYIKTIKAKDFSGKQSGQVHEVDLPENPYLLDEDKLINEQSEYVRRSVRNMLNSMPNDFMQSDDINNFGGMTGLSLYKELVFVAQRNGIENKVEQKKFASEKLSEYGIKGITYDGKQDGRCFVIFDPKDVKVIQKFYQNNMPQGTQDQTAGRRGEIEHTPEGYVIRLFQQSDPSTLFHEMWHLFTFQLQEAAKKSDRAKADWETLANWSGYNQAVTPEEKRAAIERMARGGEQYLMKGKAPSNRLKAAFENFKNWLTDIYKSLRGLNVEINYDVEKVFGRLLGGKSLDYAFISEKTELGQELKKLRQKNIEMVVSGRYIISDQTQMQEITGIERIKALTQAIIDLSKTNKGKDLLLVMSDKYGDQTIEDIGNLIRTTHMRLPRRGDTLYTKLIKEGGITKELDQQFDITGLMGLERNDKLVRKPTKKEKIVDAKGNEKIVWDTSKKKKPIETEEQLIDFLKALELLPELQTDYTYADLDAEWSKAMDILEKAPETYLDNGARKLAEETVAEANRILEDIFNKPVAEIEEDYENFLTINRDFDLISKEMLADIRGLSVLIERETHKLQRLIKQNALEDARAVRDDIIGLLERSLPVNKRGSFLKYISEIDTYERLISRLPKLVDRIVKLQENMFKEKIYGRINNILKWSKSYKDSSGKRVSKFRDGDVQDFMDEANDLFNVKNKEKAGEMIEKMLPNDDASMPSRENVFKIKLLQVAAKLNVEEVGAENYLDVYNVLLDTYKAGKFAGEAERELRIEKDKKLAKSAFDIISAKKPQKKGLWADIKQGFKTYGYTQQGWEDLIDILSSGDKSSKEYQSELSKNARVLRSEVEERGIMNRWGVNLSEYLGEALGTTDQRAILTYVRNLGKKVDLGTFETTRETKWGGATKKTLELSKDEMLDFYMKWKDEGSKKAILSDKGNGFTEDMANTIISNLTEQDIRVADALFAFYRSTRDQVFEAYRDEYGVSLGRVEFYSPRYREVNGDIESYYRGNIKSVSTGRVKERNDSVEGAIQFLGAFKTADRYIGEVSHYLAWRQKLRDLNTMFGDKDIREAIRERFGNSMVKLLDKQIQDFATNGRTNANLVDKLVNGFRVNFTVAALSIKPALTLKQMTSMFAFAEYVPTKDFLKDLTYAMTHFKEIRAILDESPLMKTRFSNMQLEVNELVNKKAVQRFIQSPKLQEALMLFVQLGDIGAIYTGGWSVYAQAIREGKSKQEALQIFEQAANSSQQSSYLSELSDWQRGGVFQKLFTMFASSQNQYFRKEASAIRNLINGRVDRTKALKRIAIYHFLLPMLFQWVCDLGRWDTKAQIRAALIGSFNGIFGIKDLFDALVRKAQGERVFDQTIPLFATGDNIVQALGKLSNLWLNDADMEDVLDALKDLGAASAEGFGLPLEQIGNLWEGAMNVYEGNVVEGIEMLAGWTPYAVKNAEGGLPRDIVDALK